MCAANVDGDDGPVPTCYCRDTVSTVLLLESSDLECTPPNTMTLFPGPKVAVTCPRELYDQAHCLNKIACPSYSEPRPRKDADNPTPNDACPCCG